MRLAQGLLSLRRKNNPGDLRDYSFAEPPKAPEPVQIRRKCGDFYQDDEYQAKLRYVRNVDSFGFTLGQNLDGVAYDEMKACLSVRISTTNKLMYEARVYTTQLGDIKLYHERTPRYNSIYRVKILDLYPKAVDGVIVVRAKVQLLDRCCFRWVDFSNLYDYPHQARCYQNLKPEVYPCKLHLAKTTDAQESDFVNNKFSGLLKSLEEEITVKIIDYEDDRYSVDILGKNGESITNRLIEKCGQVLGEKLKMQKKDENSGEYNDGLDYLFKRVNIALYHKSRYPPKHKPRYISSVMFFRDKLIKNITENKKPPAIRNNIIRVKVLSWHNPACLSITPLDEDFANHDRFLFNLEKDLFKSFDVNDPEASKRIYKTGQEVLFKVDLDMKQRWCRGIIVSEPSTSKVLESISDESPLVNSLDLVYKIRSIDYGFMVFRTNYDIRRVTDSAVFSRQAPYALRVKLFGVHPRPGKSGELTSVCRNGIDRWLRSRMIEYEEDFFSYFFAIFRDEENNILKKNVNIGSIYGEITLVHRLEEYRSTYKDMYRREKKKPPFACLNTYLIEKGFASDHHPKTGRASKVQIDEYLINLLNGRRMI